MALPRKKHLEIFETHDSGNRASVMRFTLSNLMLSMVPLGISFWSAVEMFRPHDVIVSILLFVVFVVALSATFSALLHGRIGMQQALLRGAAAVSLICVTAFICITLIMLLFLVAGLFT